MAWQWLRGEQGLVPGWPCHRLKNTRPLWERKPPEILVSVLCRGLNCAMPVLICINLHKCVTFRLICMCYSG